MTITLNKAHRTPAVRTTQCSEGFLKTTTTHWTIMYAPTIVAINGIMMTSKSVRRYLNTGFVQCR